VEIPKSCRGVRNEKLWLISLMAIPFLREIDEPVRLASSTGHLPPSRAFLGHSLARLPPTLITSP